MPSGTSRAGSGQLHASSPKPQVPAVLSRLPPARPSPAGLQPLHLKEEGCW